MGLEMMQQRSLHPYASGEHFLVWRSDPDLWGLVLWGRPTLADMRLLEQVVAAEEHGAPESHSDFLVDARRLDGLDVDLVERLQRLAGRRADEIRLRVRRQAFVWRSGLVAAAVAGFRAAVGGELESRMFACLAQALAWLDEPAPDTSSLSLDALVAEAMSEPSLVGRLRAYLAERGPSSGSVGEAGRTLGVSTRSLQRHLRQLRTSFRKEAHLARLDMSKRLLQEQDLKIAAVAQRLGFSTEANFIASFRRAVGLSPAEWRRRNRRLPESSP
jgi:AraC-like DNA-binding protein